MNPIVQQFKQVFISPKNTGYLFDLIISKILKSNPHFQPIVFGNLNQYKQNIIDVQDLVFQDFFIKIYNQRLSNGRLNLEDILIELNQITVSKFEYILIQDLTNKTQGNTYNAPPTETTETRVNNVPTGPTGPTGPTETRVENAESVRPTETRVENDESVRQSEVRNVAENDTPDDTPHDAQVEKRLEITYKEFFSENAVFEGGKYTFRVNIDNLRSINIDNIRLRCNLYNITEYNNKFYLLETGSRTPVIIPIGYYDTDMLVKMISECLNAVSINRNKDYFYKVFINDFKNKICFLSDFIDTTRNNRPTVFGLSFVKSSKPNYPDLGDILGFTNQTYTNNNMYITEQFANVNIYEDIYIKMYLDGKELPKYESSGRDFYYFDKLNVDMSKSFGKTVERSYDNPFYLSENNIETHDLSIRLYYNYDSYIEAPIWFKCNVSFETSC